MILCVGRAVTATVSVYDQVSAESIPGSACQPLKRNNPNDHSNRLFNRIVFQFIFQPRGEGRIICSSMPSFSDSIFLFILALLLFGPKRLPVLARELGKWVGEFRRASNEFKMQMEEELRLSEQSDRQKQIAAMEAAAPVTPPIPESEPLELSASSSDTQTDAVPNALSDTAVSEGSEGPTPDAMSQPTYEMVDGVRTPLPIATSGELSIMPPSTGLPTPQQTSGPRNSALRGLLDALPAAPEAPTEPAPSPEITAHGN